MEEVVAQVQRQFGPKPKCLCGTCRICKGRVWHRNYRKANGDKCRAALLARYKADPEKYRELAKSYAKAHPESIKATKLRGFNITLEQYNAMLEAQGGVCAICSRPETAVDWRTRKVRQLSVDHDRSCCPGAKSCGKCVRGLLCGNCNHILGKAKDTPHLLESAAYYLRYHLAKDGTGELQLLNVRLDSGLTTAPHISPLCSSGPTLYSSDGADLRSDQAEQVRVGAETSAVKSFNTLNNAGSV